MWNGEKFELIEGIDSNLYTNKDIEVTIQWASYIVKIHFNRDNWFILVKELLLRTPSPAKWSRNRFLCELGFVSELEGEVSEQRTEWKLAEWRVNENGRLAIDFDGLPPAVHGRSISRHASGWELFIVTILIHHRGVSQLMVLLMCYGVMPPKWYQCQ